MPRNPEEQMGELLRLTANQQRERSSFKATGEPPVSVALVTVVTLLALIGGAATALAAALSLT